MLDPRTASSVKSRYKNKYLNCDLIIITTVLDINEFYQKVFSEQNEPVTQLKRRCSVYITVFEDIIVVSTWDPKKKAYTNAIKSKNNLLDEFIYDNSLFKDTRQLIEEYMPFLEPIEPSINKGYLDENFKEITEEEFNHRYN